jgi:uncharacterized membrane protein
MIKIIQIAVIGIFIFLVIRMVRLIMRYVVGSRKNLDGSEKEREEIKKQFENIEEAEFKDITSNDEADIKDSSNG